MGFCYVLHLVAAGLGVSCLSVSLCASAVREWRDPKVCEHACPHTLRARSIRGNAAMHQCRQCQTAVSYYALNRTAASNVSVDVSSTRVECELPPWNPNHCARSVKGFGIGVLIATGISLLIVASVGGIAFDWRLLPAIVSRERRKLLVPLLCSLYAISLMVQESMTVSSLRSPKAELPKIPRPGIRAPKP